MSNYTSQFHKLQDKIDRHLASTTSPDIAKITAGGKRLRSMLTMLVFEELSDKPDEYKKTRAINLACSIEIIHALTLAADDIIDQDETRRGKPSLYTLKGLSLALLEIISGLSVPYDMVRPYGSEYEDAISSTQKMMCSGVVSEITKDLPASTLYTTIITRKTGSLFSLAARFGAMAADAPTDVVEKMAHFGLQLGNTYQIKDDIQDLLDVMFNNKTEDPITGTEFILLKCVQLDDMSKELVKDILAHRIAPDKAKTMLHTTGVINVLVRRRDHEKEKTLKLAGNNTLMRLVEHCVPENVL